LVEVVVHGGKMTQAGSSWGEKVITPYFNQQLLIELFHL
jgi:hypothetical protein